MRRYVSLGPLVAVTLGVPWLLGSCTDVSGLRPSPPIPVVQLLLIGDRSDQIAVVEYSAPPDSLVPLIRRPVRGDSVTLVLVAPDGTRLPLEPVPGQTTRFRVTRTVHPGEPYQLTGTVAGATVSAAVTVPGPLALRQPMEDTLHFSTDNFRVSLPAVWFAPGASTYLATQVDAEGHESPLLATTDTTAALPVNPFFLDRPDTTRLVVWAYDAAGAEAFLGRDSGSRTAPPAGHALVAFGAAVPAVRQPVILWQVP